MVASIEDGTPLVGGDGIVVASIEEVGELAIDVDTTADSATLVGAPFDLVNEFEPQATPGVTIETAATTAAKRHPVLMASSSYDLSLPTSAEWT